MPKLVLLWTDAAIWAMALALLAYVAWVRSRPGLRASWSRVFAAAPALSAAVVLLLCLAITLLDSVHYRARLPSAGEGTAAAHDPRTRSLLDALLRRLVDSREATYSRPLSYVGFTKESVEVDGRTVRIAPRLQFGGAHLSAADPLPAWRADLAWRGLLGVLLGALLAAAASALLLAWLARARGQALRAGMAAAWRGQGQLRWRAACATLLVIGVLAGPMVLWAGHYHVFGTDLTGNDVLYQALKSIRTAFVIGTLATVATLPLAVGLGIAAGYLRGWVDEAIQYLYTVLSSVPNVLLIAACVLMVQVFIDQRPEAFATSAERADLKLFWLCAVLGLTGWAGLCRNAEAARTGVRACGAGLRREPGADHAPPHLPQRRAPDADRHGARLQRADPL